MNNLPNPLPAGLAQNLKTLTPGTVVFVPDENGSYATRCGDMYELAHPEYSTLQRYTRHVLTSPVHLPDEGMVEAVCCLFENPHGLVESSHARRLDAVRAAFAHVLVPPQETGKDAPKTCREKCDEFRAKTPALGDTWSEVLNGFADLVEFIGEKQIAQQQSIDALRAEVKEGRNG